MRIVLIGTVIFSREILSHLINIGFNPVGVCTSKASGINSDYADLQPICESSNTPLHRTNDINSEETFEWICNKSPDVIFCVGWSRLIGPRLLALPRLGVIGYHPAKLPQNRGRHPLIWALALGLQQTASSFFVMDESADGGDILSQVELSISPNDDAGSLYKKIIDTAKNQLTELVYELIDGGTRKVKQNHNIANYWRKRNAKDGLIDWRMSGHVICNLVRALTHPYPGADISTESGLIKVWKAELITDAPLNFEPGKVIRHIDGHAVVRCGEQAVCLVETEPNFVPNIGSYL